MSGPVADLWPRGRSDGAIKHPLEGPKTVFFVNISYVSISNVEMKHFRAQNVIQDGPNLLKTPRMVLPMCPSSIQIPSNTCKRLNSYLPEP